MAEDYGSSVGRSCGRAIGKAAVEVVFKPRRRRRVQATVARSQAGGCSGSGAFIIVLGIFGLTQLLVPALIALLVLVIGSWLVLQEFLVVMRVGVWFVPIAERNLPRVARELVRMMRFLADQYW
jgi:hypothetical protein